MPAAAKPAPPAAHSRRGALLVLLAMSLIYVFSYFHRVAVPGQIFDDIQSSMRLSAAAVTTLGAVFFCVYAGMQFPMGMAVDRWGGMRMLLLGGLVMCAGSIVFPLSHSVWLMYASRAITAFGASFMYLCLVREIDALFEPRQFPKLLGLVLLVGYGGGVAGTAPFQYLVSHVGWRTALLAVGILSSLTLAAVWLLLRRFSHPRPRGRPMSFRPLADILFNRRSFPLLVCAAINFPVYFVIQSTLGKKFLQDVAGLSSGWASNLTFVMMLATAVLVPLGGFSLHLTGHRRKPFVVLTAVLVLAASLLMLAGVRLGWGGGLFLLCYLMLAVSTALTPAVLAAMKELNRPDTVALSIGVYNTLAYIGGALLANVSGVVLDHYRHRATATAAGIIYPPEAYMVIFAILLALGLMSVVSSLLVPETGAGLRPSQ